MPRTRLRAGVLAAAVVIAGLGAAPAYAVTGGTAVADGGDPFVVQLHIGDLGRCTGALVDAQWVLTATNCFAAAGQPVPAGTPPQPTTATIGGTTVPVTRIVAHPDRGITLAKLPLRLTGVTTIPVAGAAAATGDQLTVAGYGRTATDWVPTRLQQATATVRSTGATTLDLTGTAACKGDAGAPVFRTAGGTPQLVGLGLGSPQRGCLGSDGTADGSTVARLDDLAGWIGATAAGPLASFGITYVSTNGIGGFDLSNTKDQTLAYDYDHSGRADHVLTYRPGSSYVAIARHNPDNSFTTVYSSTHGIGGFDLATAGDRMIAYDYEHSGKLDYLLIYRPVSRIVFVVRHNPDNSFSAVWTSSTGIGGYDLAIGRDRMVPFDYDHSGKLDHLLLYRPGDKIAFVVEHTATGFATVWSSFAGVAGFDLGDTADQITPYDYDGTGRTDHLVLYRPGKRYIVIARHRADNTFGAVYTGTNGIGGYDLAVPTDRIVAFDAEHTGGLTSLAISRPGNLLFYVVRRQSGEPADPPAGTAPAAGPSIVEDGAYPGAARIEAEQHIKLISGDGHITIADCATPPVDDVGVLKIHTTDEVGPGGEGLVCFRITGVPGVLNLEVPAVYEIRGDGQKAGHGHQVTAKVTTDDGDSQSVAVNPSGSTQVGVGTSPDAEPTTLVQLKVDA